MTTDENKRAVLPKLLFHDVAGCASWWVQGRAQPPPCTLSQANNHVTDTAGKLLTPAYLQLFQLFQASSPKIVDATACSGCPPITAGVAWVNNIPGRPPKVDGHTRVDKTAVICYNNNKVSSDSTATADSMEHNVACNG
jgi:hypothetical protein